MIVVFFCAFTSWLAAVMYLAVEGLVLLKDRRRVWGSLVLLLATALLLAGLTGLYQLGEVPS